MISAVAARKAALAAASASASTSAVSTQTQDERVSSASSSRAPPKRKPSGSHRTGTGERKRAKLNEAENKRNNMKAKKDRKEKSKGKGKQMAAPRYFAPANSSPNEQTQDAFKEQEDVIVVGSGSDDSDIENSDLDVDEADPDLGTSSESSGSNVNIQLSTPAAAGSSQTRTKPKTKRRWSPSRVTRDSSEDEAQNSMDISEDTQIVGELDLSTFFPQSKYAADSEGSKSTRLSTFEPSVDENLFILTPDEINALNLPSTSSTRASLTPSTTVALPPHTTLCLLGTCSLTVLHGSIAILGTTLYPSKQPNSIFAPSSSPLPVIQCSFPAAHRGSSNVKTPSLLPDSGLPQRVVIEDEILQRGAVFLLQELKTGVEGLGKICRTFDGVFEPPKWQRARGEEDLAPFSIPGLFMISYGTRDVFPYVLPHTWSDALEKSIPAIDSPEAAELCGAYLVKGPKNAGKSTFARNLLNHLLEVYHRVAYLECDLGQSEFTPGGMVSLNIISTPVFGPPFTHPSLPTSAHYIGSPTPRSSPSHYLDAIQALLQVYRLEVQTPSDEYLIQQDTLDREHHPNQGEGSDRIHNFIPLVINTMGWVKGLGADLTKRIHEWASPTEVFVFESDEGVTSSTPSVPIRRNPTSHFGAYSTGMDQDDEIGLERVYHLDSASISVGKRKSTTHTAADYRALSILSYFHAVFPSTLSPSALAAFAQTHTLPLTQVTAHEWNTTLPLVAIPPYEVDCAIALDKVVLTGAGSEDVVPEEAGRVINGALVGVVSCDEGAFAHASDEVDFEPREIDGQKIRKHKLPYTQRYPPPSPALSTCVGLALVRGVPPHLIDGGGVDMDVDVPSSPSGLSVDPDAHAAEPALPHTLLHVLSPLPPTLLGSARVFVKGEMELPIWGMLDFRSFEPNRREGVGDAIANAEGVRKGDLVVMERGKTPFLQWGRDAEGVLGAEKRRVRRNLMRRGQT